MLTSEKIAAELTDLLPDGASLKTLLRADSLTDLAIVRAKARSASDEDLAASAIGVLRESCVRVDGQRNGVSATLLGLAEGTQMKNLTGRRGEAAQLVPISESRFRKKRAAEYVTAVAEDLVIADSVFRARADELEQMPAAGDSRLRINWLARHEAYRRIWSPVSALRGDLLVLLEYLRTNRDAGVELSSTDGASPAPWSDIADRGMNLMWRRAQFTAAVDQFVEEFGGLWLLSDPNQESRAAEAIHQLDLDSPCGDADDSWLRLRLVESTAGELDDFIDRVYANEVGSEMLQTFLTWADNCRCNLASGAAPRSACEVHRWLAACDEYLELIDEDWDNVVDWYRQERQQ